MPTESGSLAQGDHPARQEEETPLLLAAMQDQITGVVVLQAMSEPGIWHLYFEYTRADGIIGHSWIPMKRRGDPHPQNHEGPLWDFFERSPFLDCSPSVRILGPHEGAPDHFHNTGQWSNYYVVMKQPFGSEPDGRDLSGYINSFEPGEFDGLTDAAKQTKAKSIRDSRIFKLRDEGILL